MLAIRDGDFKLLLNPDNSRVELYDIPKDPTQLINIAEKHPDLVNRTLRPRPRLAHAPSPPAPPIPAPAK